MRAFSALCLILFCIGSAEATSFNLNATLPSGTIGGTLQIDTVAGLFTGANVDVMLNGNNYLFTSAPSSQGVYTDAVLRASHVSYYYGNFQDGIGDDLFLSVYQTASLVGYTGAAPLCSLTNFCVAFHAGPDSYYSFGSTVSLPAAGLSNSEALTIGTLTPTSVVTPEPGTLELLGTGVLAAAGMFRHRRSARRSYGELRLRSRDEKV